jgi:nucleotide-binding universal stress UspA family protein
MVSSFVTENAGRIIAIEEADPANELLSGPERILIPVSDTQTIQKMIDIAILTRPSGSDTMIYPLSIVNDDDDAQATVMNYRKLMAKLASYAVASDTMLTPVTRIDINIPTGISRAVKELLVTKIVLSWSGRSSTANYFFGNIIDKVLEHIQQMVMVVKADKPIGLLKNIPVLVPANADREIGFAGWINALISMSKSTGGNVIFLTNSATIKILKNRLKEYKFFNDDNFMPYEYYPNVSAIPFEISENDLLIAVAARPSTISFSRRQLVIPKLMSHFSQERNFIIIYPEQVEVPVM